MIILYYFFYASLSKGFAFAQEETHSSSMKDLSPDIFSEVIVMKECLVRRVQENNTNIDSISNCTATVEESVKEVQDSLKEYQLGIKYPGKKKTN